MRSSNERGGLMVRINLLPHRQIKRAEQQRQFGVMAFAVLAISLVIAFLGWSYIEARKEAQEKRNQRLESAIAQLDVEIKDIKVLKDQISSVLERKQIVENLQTNRSQAVVVMDEIARQLPQGLFVKSIKQDANSIEIQGVADTNARIATLVRNLSVSNLLESPTLIEIKANTVKSIKQNDFVVKVKLKTPQVDTKEQAKSAGTS
jgi:type IV pilus assembly protein PilN